MFTVVTFVYYSYAKAPNVSTEVVETKYLDSYMSWVKTAFIELWYTTYKEEREWIHNFTMIQTANDENGNPVSWIMAQAVIMVQQLQDILVDENRKLIWNSDEDKM